MDFSRRLSLAVLAILTLFYAAICATSLRNQSESLRKFEAGELSAVSLLMRASLARAGATATAEAQIIGRQIPVVEAIAAGNKDALVRLLQDTHAYLKAQTGVSVFGIQSADLRTIVRLHDLGRDGEDVSASRPMVVTANRSRQDQTGIEFGTSGLLALRGVVPVMKGGTLVGTAEIGFELEPLLRSVKAASGADIAVVLSTAMTGVSAGDGRSSGDLVLSDSTDTRLFGQLISSSSLRLAREPLQLQAQVDGEDYGISIDPLQDYSGRMIGGIIGARNFSAAHREASRDVFFVLFLAFCGLVVCYSIVVVSIRAFLMRPLSALNDYVDALGKGEVDLKTPSPGGTDEFARLSRSVAAITDKLAGQDSARKPGEVAAP